MAKDISARTLNGDLARSTPARRRKAWELIEGAQAALQEFIEKEYPNTEFDCDAGEWRFNTASALTKLLASVSKTLSDAQQALEGD